MSRKTEEQKLADILRKVQEDEEDEIDDEHLPFLFRALHSLASNWYGFSLQLGVSGLDKIQSDGTTVDDCLVLALQRWLKSDDTSWTVLVTAIFRPAGGGNQRLAAEVAGSYRELCSFRPRDYASETSTQEICASAGEVSSAVRYIQELLAAKVAPRWYQMGVVLGVQVAVLESIRLNNNPAKDSERQMFDAWLENASLPQTWQVLVDAIGHEAGGNHRKLAKTVSKKVSTQPSGSGATANGRTVSESSTSSAVSSLEGSASPVMRPTLPNLDQVPQHFQKTVKRGDRVVILGLQQFSTPSGRLNILQQVGTDYKPMLGNILLKSQNGKRVQTIETTFGHNVDNVVYDIFQKWSSEDGDCTWGKLVQCLRDSNLNPLANDIDSCLL